jgi:hypothetical protein
VYVRAQGDEVHAQLQAIINEFGTAQERLDQLAATVPVQLLARRAIPASWSIGECIEHLNLTSEAFLPLVREAIERGRAFDKRAPKRYRRDFVGWLLWRTSGPPVRFRIKTTPGFVPGSNRAMAAIVCDFRRLQTELVECVCRADGLPLRNLRIVSPFDSRVKYNLYSCLTILPRHQHRHLWQAEQVWLRLSARVQAAT